MTQCYAGQARPKTYRGRYAPSPSGAQHLGNLRTALIAWMHARLNGGEFLLRMEDIDTPRVVPGSAEQILRDLEWLGIDWDGEVLWQSTRLDRYQEVFHELQRDGSTFPCFCSRKQLRELQDVAYKGGEIVYPGTCRTLDARQITLSAQTKSPAYRLKVEPQDLLTCGDFVLKRADGLYAYQLVVVIDDLDQSISHVVRGADLFDSTARQKYLAHKIKENSEPLHYLHVPLMNDASGQKLSKRDGSYSLAQWRAEIKAGPEVLISELLSGFNLSLPKSMTTQEALQALSLQQIDALCC